MGVPGLWSHLAQAGTSHNLETLHLRALVDVMPSEERLPIIGVDLSAWLFHARLSVEGSNPILRLIFFRLARLLSLPLKAVFVFDGPLRPRVKRGRSVGAKKHPLTGPLMEMLATFGAIGWEAPGEAEAELARMNSQGLIDAVLSDDVDSLIFGAVTVMRNWSQTLSQARPISAEEAGENIATIYRSSNIRELPDLLLDRDGLILVALMAGGDYDVGGLGGCGVKTAIGLAQAGHGQTLLNGFRKHCKIVGHDPETRLPSVDTCSLWLPFLEQWQSEVCEELQTNKQGFLNGRSPKLAQSDAFRSFLGTQESLEVLGSYVSPVTTCSLTEEGAASTSNVTQPSANRKLKFRDPDLPAMASFAQRTFAWGPKATVARLRNVTWKGILLQELRRGGVVQWTSPNEIASQSSEEGETIQRHRKKAVQLEVLKIHGERRHAETGHLLEYRVEWDPTPLAMSAEEGIDPFLNVGPGYDEDIPCDIPTPSQSSSAQSTDAEHTEEELPPCSPYGLSLVVPSECPASPTKRKARSLPDPYSTVRTWILTDRLEANKVGKGLIEEYQQRLVDKDQRRRSKKSTGGTNKSKPVAGAKGSLAASHPVTIDSIFTSRKGSVPIATQRPTKGVDRRVLAPIASFQSHASQSEASSSKKAALTEQSLHSPPATAIATAIATDGAKTFSNRTFGRTQSGPAVLSQSTRSAGAGNAVMVLSSCPAGASDDEDEEVTFVLDSKDDPRDVTLTRPLKKPDTVKKRSLKKISATLAASSDTEQVLADDPDTSLPDAMEFLRTIGQRGVAKVGTGIGLEGSPSPRRSNVKRVKQGRGMREGSPPVVNSTVGRRKGSAIVTAVRRSGSDVHIPPRPTSVHPISAKTGQEARIPKGCAIALDEEDDDEVGFELMDYRQRLLPLPPASSVGVVLAVSEVPSQTSTTATTTTSSTRFHATTTTTTTTTTLAPKKKVGCATTTGRDLGSPSLQSRPVKTGGRGRGGRRSDAIVLSDSDQS